MSIATKKAPITREGEGANNNPARWWVWPAVIFALIALVAFNSWLQSGKPSDKYSEEQLSHMLARAAQTHDTAEARPLLRYLKTLQTKASVDDDFQELIRDMVDNWEQYRLTPTGGDLLDVVIGVAIACAKGDCHRVGQWMLLLEAFNAPAELIARVTALVRLHCCPDFGTVEHEEGGPGSDRDPTGGKRPDWIGKGKKGGLKPPRPKTGRDGKRQ